MIGLVLVTHGRLAEEFKAALEHVVGPQEQVETISIGPDDDMEQRRQDILAAVEAVERKCHQLWRRAAGWPGVGECDGRVRRDGGNPAAAARVREVEIAGERAVDRTHAVLPTGLVGGQFAVRADCEDEDVLVIEERWGATFDGNRPQRPGGEDDVATVGGDLPHRDAGAFGAQPDARAARHRSRVERFLIAAGGVGEIDEPPPVR